MLLDRGAEVDARNTERSTPLHFSAANGNPKTTHTLLEWGANPELTNVRGNTALELAKASVHRKTDRFRSTIAILENHAAGQ